MDIAKALYGETVVLHPRCPSELALGLELTRK